jgi:hypothetical protein
MEEREIGTGLFFVEMNRCGRRANRWKPGKVVFIPLWAQRSVMGGTAALAKTVRIEK